MWRVPDVLAYSMHCVCMMVSFERHFAVPIMSVCLCMMRVHNNEKAMEVAMMVVLEVAVMLVMCWKSAPTLRSCIP